MSPVCWPGVFLRQSMSENRFPRLLRFQHSRNNAMHSINTTAPPTAPPMIAAWLVGLRFGELIAVAVGLFCAVVLGEEPVGLLLGEGVM